VVGSSARQISVGKWLDNLAISKLMERTTGLYKSFADRLGIAFRGSDASCTIDLWKPHPDSSHAISRRDLSIVHGDAHVRNYFRPRDASDDIRLFDWDAWRIGRAANGLAYMIATHWYPERRQRMERPPSSARKLIRTGRLRECASEERF
jgi:hypothetical protein